jgi:hypothetical protein
MLPFTQGQMNELPPDAMTIEPISSVDQNPTPRSTILRQIPRAQHSRAVRLISSQQAARRLYSITVTLLSPLHARNREPLPTTRRDATLNTHTPRARI